MKKATKTKKKQSDFRRKIPLPDRHMLYEAAVQNADESIQTMRRIFKNKRGRQPRLMREDFCGTAALTCAWGSKHSDNRAWGVDLDKPTLEWGRKHNLIPLGKSGKCVKLICGNVLSTKIPRVDVINAFNFSYFVFKERSLLLRYFKAIHAGLKRDGMFICDLFGGTETMMENKESQIISASVRPDGLRLPRFRYTWEHEHFNVVNHDILCHIHLKIPGHKQMRKAFTYNWRLWTLPEVRETLLEAGFKSAEVYIHGWTEDGESDDNFRRRKVYENSEGWIAYVVGWR